MSVFGKAHGECLIVESAFMFDFVLLSCLCFLLKFSFRYKVSLFSKWKQRGMFATCMWIVQLLLVLSAKDTIFAFVPEYYIDTLVSKSSFHASFMKLVSID